MRSQMLMEVAGWALALGVLVPHAAHAEDAAIPAQVQADLFKKIFEYDRALQDKEPMVVAIVYGNEDGDLAKSLVQAFYTESISPFALGLDQLDGATDASVVYVTPGVDPDAVQAFATSNQVLTIAGVPSWAREGKVSVGLAPNESGQPQIIVHANRLKEEGHRLSSELLKLSEVVE